MNLLGLRSLTRTHVCCGAAHGNEGCCGDGLQEREPHEDGEHTFKDLRAFSITDQQVLMVR